MMVMIMFIMMMTTVISSGGYLTKEPSHDNEDDFTIMTIVICISVTKHLRKSLVVSHF